MAYRSRPLIASTLALRLLVALSQAPSGGVSLRALARSAQVTDSSAQHAIRRLIAEGLATALDQGPRPRYRPVESRRASLLLALARESLVREDIIALAARANPAVEFASIDKRGLLVVYDDASDVREEGRFARFVRALDPAPRLAEDFHGEVVHRLRKDLRLRRRALAARVLEGSVDRSLPDRMRRGDFVRARRLGRPHPTLRVPSRRTLQRLARKHLFAGLSLFGSAVRSDFRPDSDVDVVVDFRRDAEHSIRARLALIGDLERFFGHDVDLVHRPYLDDKVRPIAEREEVRLYGRATPALAHRAGAAERPAGHA